MFDIASSELLIVGIVALIVIGPDKLPAVARTTGVLFGRMQRFMTKMKSDIDRELQVEDLKRLQNELKNHDLGLNEALRKGMQPVEEVISQNKQTAETHSQKQHTSAHSASAQDKIDSVEPKSMKQAEDLNRLENELRDHDLGLNEALRQGMQPVEEVINQSKQPLDSGIQEDKDTLVKPSTP